MAEKQGDQGELKGGVPGEILQGTPDLNQSPTFVPVDPKVREAFEKFRIQKEAQEDAVRRCT